MFIRVLKHELKGILRDQMYIFFMLFPVFLGLGAHYLIPYLEEVSNVLTAQIVTLVLIMMSSILYGAVTGFTLLDDQDDQVLLSLRITPIKVSYYVALKLSISYLFGVVSTIFLIYASSAFETDFLHVLLISLLASMQAPMLSLFVNAFATNKVEGFVMMKSTGLILMIPIASLFMTNWTEFFLGIVPGFWVARLISMEMIPANYVLSDYMYFILGVVVNFILIYLLFSLYRKRVKI